MKKELIGIFVCMLFILSSFPNVSSISSEVKNEVDNSEKLIIIQTGYVFGLINNYSEEFLIDEWVYNISSRLVNYREIVMSILPSFSIGSHHQVFKNEEFQIRKKPFKGIITDKIISGICFEIIIKDISSS